MNVINLLIADHRALQTMLNKVQKTSERAVKTRQDLFLEIKQSATIHEKAEESYFYCLLKELKQSRPDALQHNEEVEVMKLLLTELSATPVNSEEWTAKFSVYKDLTNHHIEEEENEIFSQASSLLSSKQLELCAQQILEYKKQTK